MTSKIKDFFRCSFTDKRLPVEFDLGTGNIKFVKTGIPKIIRYSQLENALRYSIPGNPVKFTSSATINGASIAFNLFGMLTARMARAMMVLPLLPGFPREQYFHSGC